MTSTEIANEDGVSEPMVGGGSLPFPVHPEGRTDLANSRRFVAWAGRDIRFCHAWKKWLIWDGKRWRIDEAGGTVRLAKRIVDSLFKFALQTQDGAAIRFAASSASAQRIAAMIKLAESEPGVSISADDLNADTMLLNCTNGTLCLKTGELRPHTRGDYITKICPTAYDPEAASCVFDEFIDAIFEGNESVIEFVKRLLGYCLTGSVEEQIIAFWLGIGANGKSTLLNAVLDTVGSDYTMKAKRDFLVVQKHQGHGTELMDLFGMRLAVVAETDDGQRLAEGFVKDVTGGDRIRGRRMKEDTWEYTPTHKIILATNHQPAIRGTDFAIWRRIRLVPFTQVFDGDRQDRQLPEKLIAAREAILAWMVRGCLEWRANGLGCPDEVANATAGYRSDQDVIAIFVADECVVGGPFKVKAADLYSSFRSWCERTGERDHGKRRFGQSMTERGYERFKSDGHWYRGIGLRASTDHNGPIGL